MDFEMGFESFMANDSKRKANPLLHAPMAHRSGVSRAGLSDIRQLFT